MATVLDLLRLNVNNPEEYRARLKNMPDSFEKRNLALSVQLVEVREELKKKLDQEALFLRQELEALARLEEEVEAKLEAHKREQHQQADTPVSSQIAREMQEIENQFYKAAREIAKLLPKISLGEMERLRLGDALTAAKAEHSEVIENFTRTYQDSVQQIADKITNDQRLSQYYSEQACKDLIKNLGTASSYPEQRAQLKKLIPENVRRERGYDDMLQDKAIARWAQDKELRLAADLIQQVKNMRLALVLLKEFSPIFSDLRMNVERQMPLYQRQLDALEKRIYDMTAQLNKTNANISELRGQVAGYRAQLKGFSVQVDLNASYEHYERTTTRPMALSTPTLVRGDVEGKSGGGQASSK